MTQERTAALEEIIRVLAPTEISATTDVGDELTPRHVEILREVLHREGPTEPKNDKS